jgi:hypothetical protein
MLEGNHQKAITELENFLIVLGEDDDVISVVEQIYVESGYETALCRVAEHYVQRSVPDPWKPQDIAWLYSMAGEVDQAMVWLERAYKERSGFMTSLHVDPLWDPVRDDPRFQELVRRLNLPE